MSEQLPPSPMNYAPPETRPGNGLALAAMICGIIGIIFTPLGLVGLILGIVALAKRRSPADPGKGMAITGVVTGGISLLIVPMCLISILLPSLNRAREAANRIKCSSNMRQIGLALRMYANSTPGSAFPPDLATLARSSTLTPDVFVDPSDNLTTPAAGGSPAVWASQISSAPSPHCSYVYPYQVGWTDAMPSDVVVLYESPSNHSGDGGNVLFGDGHAEFFRSAEMQKMIAQVQAGQNPPPALAGHP